MLRYLQENFPRDYNYLIKLPGQLEIDNFIIETIFKPAQDGHRRYLWGDSAEKLPLTGRNIGWVPCHFSLTFFSESVEQEIANAFVSKMNQVQGGERELISARYLLRILEIESLANRNPYLLSEGESKLVWFLGQWAKSPDFFIMGHLPGSLSEQKTECLINFILKSNEIALALAINSPTFLLGFVGENETSYKKLLEEDNWKLLENFKFDPYSS
jgi:hypothetical protein